MAHDKPALTRRRVLGSGAAMSIAAVAGCTGGQEGDDGNDGDDGSGGSDGSDGGDGSFIHVTQSQERAEEFDPIISNDAYSFQVMGFVFDGLYEFNEGLELEPNVATGMPEVENDGRRYLFEIHEGIEFHNGDPLTAEDVRHAFVAPVEEETENASSYDMISSVEVVDDHQLEVNMDEPYGPFELQTMAVSIPNSSVRTEDRDAYNTNPVGSGPYTFEELQENEYVVVEKFEDYWNDDVNANIDTIRFVANADNASRISDIRSENTDVALDIPNDDWSVLEGESGVQVKGAESPSYMYLAFNCNEGPTTIPEVRQGIAHSYSMSDFIENNASNVARPMHSPIPPVVNDVWGFPEDEYQELLPSYDPDRAKELLDEHAPSDWEPTIIAPAGLRGQFAERIAVRLDEIGYGADVQVLSFDQLIERYTTGNEDDYAMYMLGWTGGPDPDFYLYPLFHESQAGLNQGHYYEGSDGFHEAILEGRQTAGQDARYDIYEPVIREIVEELPAYPMLTQDNTLAHGEYVSGLEPHPNVATNPDLASTYNDVTIQ